MKVNLKMLCGLGYFGLKMIKTFLVIVMGMTLEFVAVVNDLLGRYSSFVGTQWDESRLGLRRLSGFILMRWAVRDALTQLLDSKFQEGDFGVFVYVVFGEIVVAFIFAVDSWVAIVDSRNGGEIMKEGCYLISTMLSQAIHIKYLESILYGSFIRWVLSHACGKYFALVFQSVAEVYFMVAWHIFYFAVRCRDPNPDGRRFGRRDLEGFIEGLR
ncbi:hypothetical protein L1049_019551 [Liquidambar formosana]|uniref:Uncharacterized protein n=1 Tax=Liquidambar formosana TaxID=63359 RepID=A0AAP0SBI8_LIQFO